MLEVILLIIVLALIGLGVAAVFDPSERAERKINANHHKLYLLVRELDSIHERGWHLVFPDQETLERARELLAEYDAAITKAASRGGARIEDDDDDE